MEEDKPEYSGYLLLPPNGKILLKKTWQQKYCLLYKASKFGIERLEVYDSKEDTIKTSLPKIITLENCVKITKKNDKLFSIITKTVKYEFGTENSELLTNWISAFQTVVFSKDCSISPVIEEDNDLYCSSGEGIFNVKLHSSEASIRCGLEPKIYTLILTTSAIQLLDYSDGKLLYTWPYHFIRRYGYREGKFTFEAGRKCESGEGTFYLEHSNQQEIFRCLAGKMNSMKQLLKGEKPPPILNCGENQFQAALSMEAGSRSPLPPSPTISSAVLDVDINNPSEKTQITSELLINDFRKPIPKPKPSKPPRKHSQIKNQIDDSKMPFPAENNYGNKYDHVEYRSDAWRTLGIDDVKHTELLNGDDDDEIYASWSTSRCKEQLTNVVHIKAPKVITSERNLDDNSYDTLNFLGSTNKLNVCKSGYKQVAPAPAVQLPVLRPPIKNDYDEVEPAMEGIRLADDSYLGYALIKKESKEVINTVDHAVHNNEPYAIISKPKRV